MQFQQQKTWSAFCGMPDGVEGDKHTVHISLSREHTRVSLLDGGKLLSLLEGAGEHSVWAYYFCLRDNVVGTELIWYIWSAYLCVGSEAFIFPINYFSFV